MHNSETNIIVTYWLKIFGSIIFMLLCLNGYRYGLQIAAVGFIILAIKFYDNSLTLNDKLKKKGIDLRQMYICGIVCGLTSWISFFYLKKSDGFMSIVYFAIIVLVINAIGDWLAYKKNIKNAKNEDMKENFISSSLIFLELMPALMLVIMAFGPYAFVLVSIVSIIILFVRAKQRCMEYTW